MNPVSTDIRRFATLLFECERTGKNGRNLETVSDVCEKMKRPLTVLMGQAGYLAFLGRALVLAGAEVAWLRAVHVTSNGALAGVRELKGGVAPAQYTEGSLALVAQLLGLLSAFMGEAIMVRILHETWPQLTPGDLKFRNDK